MDVTTEAIVVLAVLAIFWGWLIYEIHIAPEVDDNYNITKEDIDLKDTCNTYECIGDNKDFQIEQFNFAIESKQWSVVKNRINNQLMWGPLLKEVNEKTNT